jgi:hypothetical protein
MTEVNGAHLPPEIQTRVATATKLHVQVGLQRFCWSMGLWNVPTALPACYYCFIYSQARPPKWTPKLLPLSNQERPLNIAKIKAPLCLDTVKKAKAPLWCKHGLQCVPLNNYNLFYFLPHIRLLSSERGLTVYYSIYWSAVRFKSNANTHAHTGCVCVGGVFSEMPPAPSYKNRNGAGFGNTRALTRTALKDVSE